jgi:hypothetical protein
MLQFLPLDPLPVFFAAIMLAIVACSSEVASTKNPATSNQPQISTVIPTAIQAQTVVPTPTHTPQPVAPKIDAPEFEKIFCEELQIGQYGNRWGTNLQNGNSLRETLFILTGDNFASRDAIILSSEVVNDLGIQNDDVDVFTLILVNNIVSLRRTFIEPSKERSIFFAKLLLSEMRLRDANAKDTYACITQEFYAFILSNWR